MSTRASEDERTYTIRDSERSKSIEATGRFSVSISITPTPIFSYKPEILNPKPDPHKFVEVIKVVQRAPGKPTHRKLVKMPLEVKKKAKTKRLTYSGRHSVRASTTLEGGDRSRSMSVAKDFTFRLEKRSAGSSQQWYFPQKDVTPIIRGKKIDKSMKDTLYGLKWRSSIKLNMGFDPYKVYNFGEPGCGSWRGIVQDFKKIRDYHLRKGTLFVDPVFPPSERSITYSGEISNCFWARPKEIMPDAKLFIKGFSRFDVNQGALGDCWFLSSIATLTQHHNLFLQVVPLDQSFSDKYAGIFHFRFWQYGRWIDVVIDDFLPIRPNGELLFTKSSAKKEFWPALLEKAYAKLHGSYEALSGGDCAEAMEDFTGGVTELYETNNPPPNLFNIMLRAFARGSLMTLGTARQEGKPIENVTEIGLVEGHAYAVTRVLRTKIKIGFKTQYVELVRIRNPWGDSVVWKGAWSDRSDEWLHVSKEEKERVGLNFDHDGEFWMSFADMLTYLTYVNICDLSPECTKRARKWEVTLFEGEWVTGVTAGGCPNFEDTFPRNPQYLITLEEPDNKKTQLCTVVISVIQKNRRRMKEMGVGLLDIGYVIYHIDDPKTAPKPLDKTYLYSREFDEFCDYDYKRSITKRFELPVGTYCIIPSTFDPDEDGEFVLRIFSEQSVHMKENEQKIGVFKKRRICMCSPIDTNLPTPSQLEKLDKHSDKTDKDQPDEKDQDGDNDQPTKEDTDVDGDKDYPPRPKGDDKNDTVPDESKPKPNHHPEPPKIIPDEAVLPEIIDPKDRTSFMSETVEELSEEIASLASHELVNKRFRSSRIISNDPELQKEIETQFLALSGDDEEINWEHLQKLLDVALKNLKNYQTFETDLCRSLVAFYDENQSGKLFYEEFAKICRDITSWTTIFYKHATDNNITMSGDQLRAVINEAGFAINSHTLNLVFHRFGNGEGGVDYQDVLMCIIRVKNMISGFKERCFINKDIAQFKLEDFMDFVMYS